ncbi:hypothetical protein I7I50_10158 [Histoplasma capsulatum G186AR]|uniref:Uncharacterized protein n=1 Tax=Ajellomyces capsulatus TaxID=5037 RepID=A0A8H7Z8X7_AJECA|nr:hypothetical protein I7I52_01398 [Histoplasma capsulatum]QSS69002.1 hypothetical protein I7I50_10158 [Histoplasma capsulatum G186AR]
MSDTRYISQGKIQRFYLALPAYCITEPRLYSIIGWLRGKPMKYKKWCMSCASADEFEASRWEKREMKFVRIECDDLAELWA